MRRAFATTPSVPWTPLALGGIVSLFALLSWTFGPELALLGFTALVGTCLVTFTAYRYPRLTVVLAFVAGALLDGSNFITFEPSVGTVFLRFFDPILLGIVMATALKLFTGDRRIFRVMTVRFPMLSLLLIWLLFTALRSLPVNGPVAAFGEFRTYHQFFFLALYVATFFPTRKAQWRLFKLLLWLSFLFIPWGLFSIPFQKGLSFASFGPDARFISAYANISFLWGVIGLYIADRQRLITLKAPLFYGLVLSFALFTVVNNHRSVWLATSASLVLLLVFRRLSSKRQLQVGIGVFLAVIALSLAPTSFNQELVSSIQERAAVFTDFQQDDTASWRFFLWQQAIEAIRERPVLGVGLGQNFQLVDPQGDIITTSPHNQYIMLTFHAGIIGLVLYVLFISNVLLLLRSALLRNGPEREKVVLFSALMVLVVVSLYYIAYTTETDFMTWLYLGLGIAALSNKPAAQRETRE